MNLKQLIILALSAMPFTGFAQSENYTIQGKVNTRYNGLFIKLYHTGDNSVKTVDSTRISRGTFVLQGKLNRPVAAKLSLGDEDNGDRTDLFLSGKISVAAKDSIRYASITGNEMVSSYEKLAKKLRPLDDQFFGGLLNFKSMPEGEAKKAYFTKLMAGFDSYNQKKRAAIHQFVLENPETYVSLYFLDKNAPGQLLNYETTYPYYAKLSKTVRETALGKELGARLAASKGALTGEQFKDFVSTTPEGKQLSLKEVIGQNKYTLVDFWASWCGPCRKENPNVVKTFNAFKEKGFTVLSVSLDEDATKWKDAIQKDGMPWYHVSSLKGWKEPAALLYNIRSIPQNVLVDSQGKIVATNLREETLYQKVESLLGGATKLQTFQFNGSVQHPAFENNTVLLSYHDGTRLRYDTTRVRQGKFELKGTLKKTAKVFVFIGYSKAEEARTGKRGENRQFYLAGGTTTLTGPDLQSAKISGSETQQDYEKLQQALRQIGWTDLSAKNDTLVTRRNAIYMEFMTQHPASLVSQDLMDELANPNFFADHDQQMEKIFRLFPAAWQASEDGKRVNDLLAGAKKLGIGKPAIEFTMNDINGKPVKLSDYRGKYVLLDFWASWCVPCRAENPHVVKAYEKFKDQNFTVLGVSLDKESGKKDWLAAIEKDGLPWTHVSDLKGFENVAARAYNVKSIPVNYLIDPNGKIIGVGLRGENLMKQLEKLL